METPSNRHPAAIIAHGVLTGAWNRRDPGTAVVKTSGLLGTNDVLTHYTNHNFSHKTLLLILYHNDRNK